MDKVEPDGYYSKIPVLPEITYFAMVEMWGLELRVRIDTCSISGKFLAKTFAKIS